MYQERDAHSASLRCSTIIDNPNFFAEKYRVKSARLLNWDYCTPGYYFITICTLNHNNFFGKIINDRMNLSDRGIIAKQELLKTFVIRKNIKLSEHIIMPNHIHLLIQVLINNFVETHCVRLNPPNPRLNYIGLPDNLHTHHNEIGNEERDARGASLQKMSIKSIETIPNVIKLFKASVSSCCQKRRLFFGWQSRFYDKIIRSEKEYFAIKRYIKDNPKNWDNDQYK